MRIVSVSLVIAVGVLSVPVRPAAATEALFSSASTGGYVEEITCIPSLVGHDCVQFNDFGHHSDTKTTTTTAVVSSTGEPGLPGSSLWSASARARSEPWFNRAEAHASTGASSSFGSDIVLLSGYAEANASSRWSTPLTFFGPAGTHLATMRFRITGSLAFVGNPLILYGQVDFGFVSGPGLDPDLATFETTALLSLTAAGTYNQLLEVSFPFTSGIPQQAVGLLDIGTISHAGYLISQPDPYYGDLIEGPLTGAVDADFYATVQVEQLIVPPGFTVVGAGGSALPFAVLAVPEPRTYALFAAGLALLGLVARGRRTPTSRRALPD